MAEMTSTAALRRIVLLVGNDRSEMQTVLIEYGERIIGATKIHADLIRAAEEYPGQVTAVEWFGPLGWTRYLWCQR